MCKQFQEIKNETLCSKYQPILVAVTTHFTLSHMDQTHSYPLNTFHEKVNVPAILSPTHRKDSCS